MERIKLDDSRYEAVYEKALERIRTQAPWWTHRELSDPGIMLVEMWALLCDMQSFYLDKIQESHYRKYLKLLGAAQDEGECAGVWVFFENVGADCILPGGTKLLAGKIVFETEDEARLTTNRMVSFYPGAGGVSGGNRIRAMETRRKNSFALKNPACLFSFGLQRGVKAGEELTFFVLLDQRQGRNPAGEGFCMAELSWEYWTAEGFCRAKALYDDTRGLLYSGKVCLRIGKDMTPEENGEYPIRCRVVRGAYDVLPTIYRICFNAVYARQQDTLCSSRELVYEGLQEKTELKSYLEKTGEIRVYIKTGPTIWREVTGQCSITPPVTSLREERFIIPGEELREENRQGEPLVLKLVSSVPGFAAGYEPWDVTGVTTQEIPLRWENVKRDRVSLMLRKRDGSPEFESYVPASEEQEDYDNVWHWKEDEEVIVLGDGRHGAIPEYAGDGLRITQLALWEGERGNIAIDRIKGFQREELFEGIKCRNYMPGGGGRKRLSSSESFLRLGGVLRRQNRMASGEDIKRLALETPGLIIKGAEVCFREGEIIVTIEIPEAVRESCCRERYVKEVQAQLEPYRILGTVLRVRIGEGKEG